MILRALVPAAILALGSVLAAPSAGALTPEPATWNFAQADITDAAQHLGAYGNGAIVAVIDTGVDATAPSLAGRVLPGADCTSDTCVADAAQPPSDGCSEVWHGTHVAGTIASNLYGVAPLAQILPVKVLSGTSGNDCGGDSKGIAAGMRWAVDHGANVLNLSLGDVPGLFQSLLGGGGSTGNSDEQSAALYAAQHNVLVVFAAGNNSDTANDVYNGNALLVAATGPTGALASYSDHGGTTDLAAPGGDCSGTGTKDCAILSTVPTFTSSSGYGLSQGTSMATPHVAGLAALLFAQNPGIGRSDVISALKTTAHPLANAGSGLIDAGAALNLRINPSLQVPGDPVTVAPTTVKTTFQGCPATLSVTKGKRGTVKCRISPARGATIKLQQKTAKGWTTIATVKSGKDGHFTARTKTVTSAQTLRLVVGTVTRTFHTKVRRAS